MWPSTSCPLSSLTRNIVLGRASVISPSISIFSSLDMRRAAYLTGSRAGVSGFFGVPAQPVAGVFDGALPVADLAGVTGRLELGQHLAEARARLDGERGGELVAAQQRCRWAVAAPVQRGAEHLACQSQMRLDHLGAGDRAMAARGEAIGDGQQGDVGGDRFGRAQVLVDAPSRQRRLGDQEAEAQVMERQSLQVAGEAATGTEATADAGDDLDPDLVVATEADEAVHLGPRRRLADVVEEGAEAQGGAPGHLVGERFGEERRDLLGPLAAEAGQVAL